MKEVPLALAVLTAPLAAQNVWIVDAANGPGTDFTDVPPAIAAAAPGDTIQVRPSATRYMGTTFSKGLQLIGESGVLVETLTIRDLPAGQSVVLLDFAVVDRAPFGGSLPTARPSLILENCQGSIQVQGCRVQCVRSTDAVRVDFVDCTLTTPLTPRPVRQPSTLDLVRTNVTISSSFVFSANSGVAYFAIPTPQPKGFELQESLVTMTDCQVILEYSAGGCFGLSPWVTNPVRPIEVDATSRIEFGPGTTVTQQNSFGTTNSVPFACGTNTDVVPAALPLLDGPSSSFLMDPRASIATTQTVDQDRVLSIDTEVDTQVGSVDVVVHATPGAMTAVFFSLMPGNPISSPFGDLWLDPVLLVFADSGSTDPSGEFALTTTYDPVLVTDGTPLGWQAAVVDPLTQELTLSRPGLSVLK